MHAGTPPKLITPSDFASPAKSEPFVPPPSADESVPPLQFHDESGVPSPSTATLTSVSDLKSQLGEEGNSTLVSDVSEPRDTAGEARRSEGSFECAPGPRSAPDDVQDQTFLGEESELRPVGALTDAQQLQTGLGQREEEEEGGEGEGQEEEKEREGEVRRKELSHSSHESADDTHLSETQVVQESLNSIFEVLKMDNPFDPRQDEETGGFNQRGYDEFTRALMDPTRPGQLLTSTERSEFDTEKSELVSVSSMDVAEAGQLDSEIAKGAGPPAEYLRLYRQTTPSSEEKPSNRARRDESPWPDIGGPNFPPTTLPQLVDGGGQPSGGTAPAQPDIQAGLLVGEAQRSEATGTTETGMEAEEVGLGLSGGELRTSEATGLVEGVTGSEEEEEEEGGGERKEEGEEGEEEEGEGEVGEVVGEEEEEEEGEGEWEEEEEFTGELVVHVHVCSTCACVHVHVRSAVETCTHLHV